MSKKITLDISVGTAYTILTNKNGDTFEFRTHSERCEKLLDFLMGCEEVVECGNFKVEARKKAVTLDDLLNYSPYGPSLNQNEYYKAMVEMKNLVLTLTNDIDLSRLEDK